MLSGEFQQSTTARGVLARLRNQLEALAPAEKQLAEHVMRHPLQSSRLGVTALAERVGVSSATVMRFARALGFAGYSAFRFELALEMQRGQATTAEQITPQDEVADIASKVIAADRQALLETSELIDPAALERAVELLASARSVSVFGFGSSAAVALDACYRLSCLGMRVALQSDAFMQLAGATLLGPDDVALIVSHTGRTRDALAVAREARAQGARVICLTSFLKAPLVAEADVALVAATGESAFRRGTMASRVAQFSVVDTLYVALASRKPDASRLRLARLNELLDERRVAGA